MQDPQAVRNMLALKKKSFDIKFDLDETGYQAIENIGTGAYGVVCSALHKQTKEKVAIKKIPNIFEQTIIAKRTYREIRILKHFRHDNVVSIREILKPKEDFSDFRDIYIVLDLMESDLHRIIHSKQELSDEHVRYFLYQMLRGLKYIHSANVIHRDMKPSNLLVNENCDLKIGDFGMARGVSSEGSEYNMMMTQYVATRWYRAPELLLIPSGYTGAVDMWSTGCIFAEMLGRKQLFPGRDYINQLKLIFGVLGTPPPHFQEKFHSDMLRRFIGGWGQKDPIPMKKLYPKAPKKAIDLLGKMLTIDPAKRISVADALNHQYLSKYHDPDDEPICIPAFNFEFEKAMEKNLDALELREIILKEIMDYHKPKPQLRRMQFDLRPVPQSELEKSTNKSPGTSKSTSSDCAHTGLMAYLRKKHQNSSKSNKKEVEVPKEESAESKLKGVSLILQPPVFLKADTSQKVGSDEEMPSAKTIDLTADNGETRGQYQQDLFPKPTGLPPSVQASVTKLNQLSVKAEASQSDVEMLSAKSSAEPLMAANAPCTESVPIEPTQPEVKLDTKALVKAALIRRQQNADLISERPRPITAQQRQREREEKKRKKAEKAMERKKKEKKKDKSKMGFNLTDEDKNMLQRWANMQGTPSTAAASVTSIQKSASEQRHLPAVQPIAPRPAPQPTVQISHLQNPNFAYPDVMGVTSTGDKFQPVTSLPNQGQMNTVLQHIGPVSLGGGVNTDLPVQLVDVHGKKQDPLVAPSQLDPASPTHPVAARGDNSHSHNKTATPESFPSDFHMGTIHRNPNAVLPDDLSLLNEVLNSQPDVVVTDDTVSNRQGVSGQSWDPSLAAASNPIRLPTYAEAMAHRDVLIEGGVSAGQTTQMLAPDPAPAAGSSPLDNTVFSAQAQALDNLTGQRLASSELESAAQQLLQGFDIDRLPQNQTGSVPLPPMVGGADGQSPDWLLAISKQMMRSHVEDLTLAKTPKGTGGGYGVGLDLDQMLKDSLANYQTETGLESAPLSASLLADWMEVSGDMDPKDLEALQQELVMTSPSVFNTMF